MTLPHVAVGGWTPRPRKLKPASARIAVAALTVVTTMTGGRLLGSTCRHSTRNDPMPMACDASMKGRGRMVRTTERITAATRGV